MEMASEGGLVLVHWKQKLWGVKKQLHGAPRPPTPPRPGHVGAMVDWGEPQGHPLSWPPLQTSPSSVPGTWGAAGQGSPAVPAVGCCWASGMGSKSGRREEGWPQGAACPEPRTFLYLVLCQGGVALKSGRENGWDSCPELAKGILCAIERHAQCGGATQNKGLIGVWGLVWHWLAGGEQL